MKILAIETSCDETAVAVLECESTGEGNAARFTVLGNALLSQIEIHREFGGVYPAVAKREHAKNLVPLLESALAEANMLHEDTQSMDSGVHDAITATLEREPGLTEAFLASIGEMEKPEIDAIAVTAGPGLEPALWVGVNFAKALSLAWDKPIVSVNHMEGHICTALATSTDQSLDIPSTELPLLSLLISGGHTELVLAREWLSYELIGATRDDAVGEAFDKVARMLGLPYPGGPEISRLAELARARGGENPYTLPRPMIHDPHCDFSFSGLKTSVLYLVKDKELSETQKEDLALAFEDAVADVLYAKTSRALMDTSAKTLALGGGVSANTHIKRAFAERMAADFPDVRLCIPAASLTSDNALMIGMAGFYHAAKGDFVVLDELKANGNRKLADAA
ncbi:MAG: tRNA (adenosine(37)-N6)-threonylcarbamoyltransferase complex transferase subunit TsaD [Candidatus Paceibacterota bacterium]